jgi:hypothetical protein
MGEGLSARAAPLFPHLPQFARYFHTIYSLCPLAFMRERAHSTKQRRRNLPEEESQKGLSRRDSATKPASDQETESSVSFRATGRRATDQRSSRFESRSGVFGDRGSCPQPSRVQFDAAEDAIRTRFRIFDKIGQEGRILARGFALSLFAQRNFQSE